MSTPGVFRRSSSLFEKVPSGWLLLIVLAAVPTLLYSFRGYGGDDALFHITSMLELRHAFQAHSWELGWSSGASFGFGSPRLSFYPPFDVLLATGLSFILPLRLVPGVEAWLLLSTAGISMYAAFSRLAGQKHRFAAAFFFMFSGYLLWSTIMRYDIAEAWVDATLPLNFLLFVQIVCRRQKRAVVPAAFLFAFAWLTNVPAAIVLFYSFGFAACVLAVSRRRAAPLLLYGGVVGLSLALAAFRLGPVFVEQKWIHPEALLLFDPLAYILFRHLPPHPGTILFFTACALLSAGILLFGGRRLMEKTKPRPEYLAPLLLLAAVSFILQTPVSMPLWHHLPELAYVSFPFRFQIFLALAAPLILFSPLVGWRLRVLSSAALLLLAVYPCIRFLRMPPILRIPPIAQAEQQWKNGYEEVPEYLPAAVPIGVEKRLVADHGSIGPAQKATGCDASPVFQSPDLNIWQETSSVGCRLTLGTFCYPYWHARLEDGAVVPLRCNDRRLILADLPAGAHRLALQYDPSSPMRTITAWLSASVCLALLVTSLYFRRSWKRTHSTE